jgi:threonine dehydrogenase-like Zn-dependent dehydrogenase
VIDQVDYRLEFARNIAPCEAYNFKELEDPGCSRRKRPIGWAPTCVIDAVGAKPTAVLSQCPRQRTENGGRRGHGVALGDQLSEKGWHCLHRWGVWPHPNPCPIGNVVNKGITIRANQASVKRLLPRLIEHVQNGILDPKALITTASHWNTCRMPTGSFPPNSITASSRCCSAIRSKLERTSHGNNRGK